MQRHRTDAFVMRRIPLRGNDVGVMLFTKSHGKLYTTAKGASSIKSRRIGTLDTGNMVQCEIVEGQKGWYLGHMTMVSRLMSIKQDMEKAMMYLLIMDVIDTLSPQGQQEEELYQALCTFLVRLERSSQPRAVAVHTIEQILGLLGYDVRGEYTMYDILRSVEQVSERPFVAQWKFITNHDA